MWAAEPSTQQKHAHTPHYDVLGGSKVLRFGKEEKKQVWTKPGVGGERRSSRWSGNKTSDMMVRSCYVPSIPAATQCPQSDKGCNQTGHLDKEPLSIV